MLTFIDRRTKLDNFFNKNEVVFYSNLQDLAEKINQFKANDKARMKVAKNGRKNILNFLNVKKFRIILFSKSFNRENSKRLKWMD